MFIITRCGLFIWLFRVLSKRTFTLLLLGGVFCKRQLDPTGCRVVLLYPYGFSVYQFYQLLRRELTSPTLTVNLSFAGLFFRVLFCVIWSSVVRWADTFTMMLVSLYLRLLSLLWSLFCVTLTTSVLSFYLCICL